MKLTFEQYLVRGKHRDFHVVVFPRKKYMWAFYDNFDRQYEIDGGVTIAHKQLAFRANITLRQMSIQTRHHQSGCQSLPPMQAERISVL